MLTFEKTKKKIARIIGGDNDGEYLYVYNPNNKCCLRCSSKCSKSKYRCCENCRYGRGGGCDGSGEKFRERDTFESIKIEDGGTIIPLQKENKYSADHYYIAGQTDAGKSSIIGDILRERPKSELDKDIFIFSTFDRDDALDHLKPIRIMIDDDMLDDPIQKEELKDSYVIFDDIDKIRPPKLAKACRELRDDLLQNGRKMGIRVFTTSHQIMDYKNTRDSLNSTQKIIIFPQATSSHHIQTFLKKYMGLSKDQIKEIMDIDTRFLLFSTGVPRYILWEKGCMILNKIANPNIKERGSKNYGSDEDEDGDSDNSISLKDIQKIIKKTTKKQPKHNKSVSFK
jgi:hypothetical protein